MKMKSSIIPPYVHVCISVCVYIYMFIYVIEYMSNSKKQFYKLKVSAHYPIIGYIKFSSS